jgi:hypothetical protein
LQGRGNVVAGCGPRLPAPPPSGKTAHLTHDVAAPTATVTSTGGAVEPATSAPAAVARGVLVIRAWTPGVAGEMLARVTMSGPGAAPVVHVVRGQVALQQLVTQWIAAQASSQSEIL